MTIFRIRPWMAVTLAGLMLVAGCGHKGKTRDPALLPLLKYPEVRADRRWSHSTDNGAEGFVAELRPAIGEDAVYTASSNGYVDARDLKTGKLLWRSSTHLRIVSGPTVSGDMVLVGTARAQVRALKRADGSTLWTGQASSEVMAPPVTDGRIVVVRSVDGRVYGLDAASGDRIWAFDRTQPALTMRGMSAPLILNDHVLMGLDTGKVVSLNTSDGKLAWEVTVSSPQGRSELDRLVDIDGDLLNLNGGVIAASYGGDIEMLDPSTGDTRWHRPIKSYNGLATDGTNVYVSDDDGYVWALDGSTGAQVWENKTLQYRLLSPPVVFDGYVIVGDFAGYVHWLRISDGKIVGRTRLGSHAITAAPLVGNEGLYIFDTRGKLALYRDVKS